MCVVVAVEGDVVYSGGVMVLNICETRALRSVVLALRQRLRSRCRWTRLESEEQ